MTIAHPEIASTLLSKWTAYASSRDPLAREQLLIEYLPLVRRVALRVIASLPRSVRLDDLTSAGVTGLLSSIDNYDPHLGIKFETFAVNRIRGAMMDSLRELDWVPRTVRQKARQLDRAVEELTQRLGRVPGAHEIAEILSLNLDDYRKLLDDSSAILMVSLDDAISSDHGDVSSLCDIAADHSSKSSDEALEDREQRAITVKSIKELPNQDKLVIALYYYEELTFKEIGEVLDLTESRVSQIHAKAVATLRSRIMSALNC